MQKKGQAAMEFLMTYGWALLVVLIAIGALAFFGVLNPSKFLPSQCILGPGLACEDFKVDGSSEKIFINVRNGMGEALDWFSIHINKKLPNSNEICGGLAGAIWPLPFQDGDLRKIYATFGALGEEGIICKKLNPNPNCCKVFNNLILGIGEICDQATDCDISSQVLPPTGSKFNQDLIITYKASGSQIVHKRVGKLTAQVE